LHPPVLEESNMDLGTSLRNARERAGFSLDELAARTRIPSKTLRAIEENNFDKVPAGIFVRSFIRSYAHEVGVDPTVAIAEFRTMTEPVVEPAVESSNKTVEKMAPSTSFQPELLMSRPSWSYVGIVAALLVAVIVVNRYTGSNDPPAAQPTNGVSATSAAAVPVGTSGNGIHIEMRAQGPCWVRAVVDGQIAFARVLQAGETQTVRGQRDVVMRVGDPAALSYSVNGQPGTSLGAAQVPVTVRFGTDGRLYRAS
jgi:cytoskeleton protein RodZ